MRFTGTVEWLGSAHVDGMVEWITSIPFKEWPQQKPIDEQLRPSMITDLTWHDFGHVARPIVGQLTPYFPANALTTQWMLSVVMPGHSIEPHRDTQAPSWMCRVHVPLTSNDQSSFVVEGAAHRLWVGEAYKVNTEAEHSVSNYGAIPRIHFMFDVMVPTNA